MSRDTTRDQWTASSLDLIIGMEDWRTQHPTATVTEIEQALDARLADLRTQMLQDLALQSAAATWPADPADGPTCPTCAVPLIRRGTRRRRLRTLGGRVVVLQRPYAVCPRCQRGVFPPRP